MSEQQAHTPGYVRVEKWNPRALQALVLTGLSAPDDSDYVYGSWTPFRCEADAREWARRWNNHDALTSLVEEALEFLECDPRRSVVELRERMRDAIAKAKGTVPA